MSSAFLRNEIILYVFLAFIVWMVGSSCDHANVNEKVLRELGALFTETEINKSKTLIF